MEPDQGDAERWRLAFMIDARDGDHVALERGIAEVAAEIRSIAGLGDIRLGVADRHPDLRPNGDASYNQELWRTADAAVEVTIDTASAGALADIALALRDVLAPLAASAEVMAGPIYPMVPQRVGDVFLSLAFRRDPAITSAQFRAWWRWRHAGPAIDVLGPGLLAYDQVHVDAATTTELAIRCGLPLMVYDAYDNLTWSDRQAYLASLANLEGLGRLAADEVGHIDDRTRRSALMRRIG